MRDGAMRCKPRIIPFPATTNARAEYYRQEVYLLSHSFSADFLAELSGELKKLLMPPQLSRCQA